MTQTTIHEAKTQLSKLIRQALEGEEVIIASQAGAHYVCPEATQTWRLERSCLDGRRFRRRAGRLQGLHALMKLLLDTQVLIWTMEENPNLSAADAIADSSNAVFISIASLWEMTIKLSLGTLRLPGEWLDDLAHDLRGNEITPEFQIPK